MRRFAGVTASGAATSGERCVRSAVRGYAVAVDRSCCSSSSPLSAASSAARADPAGAAGAYVAVSVCRAICVANARPRNRQAGTRGAPQRRPAGEATTMCHVAPAVERAFVRTDVQKFVRFSRLRARADSRAALFNAYLLTPRGTNERPDSGRTLRVLAPRGGTRRNSPPPSPRIVQFAPRLPRCLSLYLSMVLVRLRYGML